MGVTDVIATVSSVRGKVKIDLFYDVISPYAWFAFEVLNRYKTHWNIDLHLKPVLLLEIGKAAETTPPAMKPNRAAYLPRDLKRSSAYFNVPLKMPKDVFDLMFRKGSLIPTSFLTAVDLLYPTHLEAASRNLWLAAWGRDEDITSPEVLTATGLMAGLTPEALTTVKEHMNQPATKQRLRAYIEEAVNHGAFGLPTIIAHVGEKPAFFFGSDRFPILAQEIDEPWLGPEPSAANSKL